MAQPFETYRNYIHIPTVSVFTPFTKGRWWSIQVEDAVTHAIYYGDIATVLPTPLSFIMNGDPDWKIIGNAIGSAIQSLPGMSPISTGHTWDRACSDAANDLIFWDYRVVEEDADVPQSLIVAIDLGSPADSSFPGVPPATPVIVTVKLWQASTEPVTFASQLAQYLTDNNNTINIITQEFKAE